MSGRPPNDRPPVKNQFLKAAALALAVVTGASLLSKGDETPESPRGSSAMPYSQFLEEIERRNVTKVIMQHQPDGIIVGGTLQDGRSFSTVVPPTGDQRLVDHLHKNNITFTALPIQKPSLFPALLIQLLPLFLIVGLMVYKMRQMGGGRGGGGPLGGFAGNKAKLLTKMDGRITFNDVAGIDEAREELQEIVDYLKNPRKYSAIGAKMPTGALLVGPPGTGKTLTARAVAGEAGVPFFRISGSDFVEMYVGVGASRVRQMFEEARRNAPCIIFIDEIDAVGRARGAGHGGGNDEREQTLNQILVEMDGFDTDTGVIVIAATNRPDVLDKALLRPGRFDRQVVVPNPDLEGREKILAVHLRKVKVGPDIDIRTIARGTPGFSGADLANLVNEAALHAVRGGKKMVTMHEFELARDKVMMGYARKSKIMDEAELARTAYHEIGHALVGMKTSPPCDPLHKVTIIPRGQALGVTMNLPEKDAVSITEAQLRARLAMMFGGRKAEEIKYGKDGGITTGASNDIQQATNIAERMVKEWGFSDAVGRRRLVAEQQSAFLGQGGYNAVSISPATQELIDKEVRLIIEQAEQEAEKILRQHSAEFELLTRALLKYETLSGKEVQQILETGSETLPARDAESVLRNPAEPAANDNDGAQDDKDSAPASPPPGPRPPQP